MLLSFLFTFQRMLFAPEGGGEGGAGGGQGEGGQGQGDPGKAESLTAEKVSEMISSAVAKALEGVKGQGGGQGQGDPDDKDKGLKKQVDDENERKEKEAATQKNIEDAIGFLSNSKTFIDSNKNLLPKEFEDILNASDKKTYGSKMEQANAVRSAMIQSFFSVQDNMDMLTATQKAEVESYLKLTEQAKDAGASKIYLNIFEPTFAMIQRIEKAKEVAKSKNGQATGSEVDQAYEKRMLEQSTKYYLNGGK